MQLHWIPAKINVPDLPKNNQSCVLGLTEMELTSSAAADVVLWLQSVTKPTPNICLVFILQPSEKASGGQEAGTRHNQDSWPEPAKMALYHIIPCSPINWEVFPLNVALLESGRASASLMRKWLPLHYLGFFPHLFSLIKLCLCWPISFYLSYFAFPILSLPCWWKVRQWLDECVASEWGELTTGVLDGTQSSQKLRSCFYYM